MLTATTNLALVSTTMTGDRREAPLSNHQTILIGRAEECDVQLDDRWVSRRHCEISVDGDRVWICDLGSMHGTYVNDQMVVRRLLREGDTIRLGLTVFSVERRSAVGAG